MSDDEVPEGLGDVNVLRPRPQTKANAKWVLRQCAEGEEAWKGFVTAVGFILERDYRRARAIYDGILDPDPGAPKRHDWVLIEALVRKVAEYETNRTLIRNTVAEQYREKTGRHLGDSGTFKAKVRTWLGPVGPNS